MRNLYYLFAVALGAGFLTSCDHTQTAPLNYDAGTIKKAYAVIRPVDGQDGPRGEVWLMHEKRYLRMVVNLENLEPNSVHGVQIDQLGACHSRGPEQVYNPKGHYHAGPASIIRRVGNLGNLEADDNGRAQFRISLNNASINGLEHPIIGRSITINSKLDDLRSDPHGELGPIVACGVVGVMPPEKKEPKQWFTKVPQPRESVVPESLLWYVPETTDESADDAAASE